MSDKREVVCPQCGESCTGETAFCTACGHLFDNEGQKSGTSVTVEHLEGISTPSNPPEEISPAKTSSLPIRDSEEGKSPPADSMYEDVGTPPIANETMDTSQDKQRVAVYSAEEILNTAASHDDSIGNTIVPVFGRLPESSDLPPAPEKKQGNTLFFILGGLATLLLFLFVGFSIFLFVVSARTTKENTSKSIHLSGSPVPALSTLLTPTVAASPTPVTLFTDQFQDNKAGWSIGTAQCVAPCRGHSALITNNSLVLSEANGRILPESVPLNSFPNDLQITCTMTFLQAGPGDSAGFYVRGDSTLTHDYRFEIFANGSYMIGEESLVQSASVIDPLVTKQATSLLHPVGQANTIGIIAKGDTLVLLINGTVVATTTNMDDSSGQVALFAANGDTSSQGVQVAFQNLTITTAPAILPG